MQEFKKEKNGAQEGRREMIQGVTYTLAKRVYNFISF